MKKEVFPVLKEIAEFFPAHPVLFTICKVVVILVVTKLVVSLAKAGLKKAEAKLEKSERFSSGITMKLLKKAVLVALYVIGILVAVRQIPSLSGAVTTLLAGSGILAVVIGFAAQESFGNVISGVFVTLFKPFDVGDRVTLVSEGITGFVEDITLRHTIIRTPLDTRMLIPNSTISSAIVENTNYIDGCIVKNPIDCDVAYDTDLDFAVKVMRAAVESHPLYAGEKPATVLVTEFGASGITLRAIMCTADASDIVSASSEARILIKKAFDENGIGIPFQTITISNMTSADAIQLVTNK